MNNHKLIFLKQIVNQINKLKKTKSSVIKFNAYRLLKKKEKKD